MPNSVCCLAAICAYGYWRAAEALGQRLESLFALPEQFIRSFGRQTMLLILQTGSHLDAQLFRAGPTLQRKLRAMVHD